MSKAHKDRLAELKAKSSLDKNENKEVALLEDYLSEDKPKEVSEDKPKEVKKKK